MLTFYVIAAVFGLVFILVTALTGHHGDTSFDAHADADAGSGDVSHGHDYDAGMDFWLHFLSVRFWTYFSAAFGTIGLLLTTLSDAREPLIAIASLGSGLVAAIAIVFAFAYMRKTETSSSTALLDLIGVSAKVLVAVRKESPGKIRAEVKGEFLDLLATTEDDTVIETGSEAVIVGVEGSRAIVVSRKALFD